jgi:hypothetical protein
MHSLQRVRGALTLQASFSRYYSMCSIITGRTGQVS